MVSNLIFILTRGIHGINSGVFSIVISLIGITTFFSKNDYSSVNNGGFYKGEPIWVTAEAQNIKTGSCSWRGAEAKIKGYKPTYINAFNSNYQQKQNVDTIINWLQMPYKDRPKLITWGINNVSTTGIIHGTKGNEIAQSIAMTDRIIGYFLHQASLLNIKDSINLIIVSNHGMTDIDKHKTIFLNNTINSNWIDTILGDNAFLLINPKKQFVDSIINKLDKTKGIKAWTKDNIPENFNLNKSSRLPKIIAVADSGWNINTSTLTCIENKGSFGYDNRQKDMHGIFYAIGPAFKQNYNAQQLYNIDIYNLLTNILAIKPAPNDGKIKRVNHILK